MAAKAIGRLRDIFGAREREVGEGRERKRGWVESKVVRGWARWKKTTRKKAGAEKIWRGS